MKPIIFCIVLITLAIGVLGLGYCLNNYTSPVKEIATPTPTPKPAPRYFLQMYPPGQPQEAIHVDDYSFYGGGCLAYWQGENRAIYCGTYRLTDWGAK